MTTARDMETIDRLATVLRRIANAYQTPDELRRNATKQYGLTYEEVLELAYENIQYEAQVAIRGLRLPRKVTKT